MRVAILSESSSDEAALRIIADAVLGVTTTAVPGLPLRGRGYSATRATLATIIPFLHYKTEADGLIVVVDSNHTSLEPSAQRNRLSDLRGMARAACEKLRPVPGRIPLRVAVGVAMPAIEAWLLCKHHSDVSEATWERALRDKREPYSKLDLKRRLYGVDYASLGLMTEKMVAAARDVARNLADVERLFPRGFGSLTEQLREWRRVGS